MKAYDKEGFIESEGGNIWYGISGADKPGVPVILLHGGPGASHYYLEPLTDLSDIRPVVIYDQLGCGNSDRPKDKSFWRLDYFVSELDSLRRQLGLKKVHLLGQSWGTMLAVEYMLNSHPKGVLSLIFSSPCLSVRRWSSDCRRLIAEMDERERTIITDSEASGKFDSAEYKEAMMEFYRRHLCRVSPWPECVLKTFENMGTDVYEHMWGPSEFTIKGTLSDYERVERLKEINVPVLFTCGKHDESSPETVRYYHEMTPGSELEVFENAAHMHHLEKTELYLEKVSSFLRRAEPDGY